MRNATLLLAIAASSLGCQKSTDVKEQPGKLGNAVFGYLCTDESEADPACDFRTANPAFPKLLLGGQFFIGAVTTQPVKDTDFDVASVSDLRVGLAVAHTAKVDCSNGAHLCDAYHPMIGTALAAGITSVLAIGDNKKKDYTDLGVEAATDLSITQVVVDGSGHVTSTIGALGGTATFNPGQLHVRAAPIGASKVELAGTSPSGFAWSTSNPQVLKIVAGAASHLVEIGPAQAGTANLTVTSGSLMKTIMVTVK